MTFEVLYETIAGDVFEIIAKLLGLVVALYVLPFIKNTAIPWVKEKRMYELVSKLVKAAEKMAESGAIKKVDKKDTVVKWLTAKGVVVDAEIESLIEACVKELDLITNTTITEIKKEN